MHQVNNQVGFGLSDVYEAKFSAGTQISSPIPLGKPFGQFMVWCCNSQGLQNNTRLHLVVGLGECPDLCDLYEPDGSATRWEKTLPNVPKFAFLILAARGAHIVQFTLTKPVTAPLVFGVQGLEPAAG